MQQSREEGAKFTAKRGETFTVQLGEVTPAKWISAKDAAALLGVSKRAIQARCHAGTLPARRVQTPQGEAWEIDAAGLGVTVKQPAKSEAVSRETFTAKHSEEGAGFTVKDAPDFAARYMEQLEKENAFLRAQVEEGNRNSAELRAALREALKATPRQLEAPKDAPPQAASEAQAPARSPHTEATRREPRPLWKIVLGLR